MNKNLYDIKEEKLSQVISILKQLPKINTPDNFEYRLMTRIQNSEFNSPAEEDSPRRAMWILAPAALVLSTVVLFFVFYNQRMETENLLMSEPPLRVSSAVNESDTMEIEKYDKEQPSVASGTAENKDRETEDQSADESSAKSEKYRVVLNDNDAVITEKVSPPPYDDSKAVDIDNYIESNTARPVQPSGARLVGENEDLFDFNGFFVKQRKAAEGLDTLKAKMDSIKNVMKSAKNKKIKDK